MRRLQKLWRQVRQRRLKMMRKRRKKVRRRAKERRMLEVEDRRRTLTALSQPLGWTGMATYGSVKAEMVGTVVVDLAGGIPGMVVVHLATIGVVAVERESPGMEVVELGEDVVELGVVVVELGVDGLDMEALQALWLDVVEMALVLAGCWCQ